MPLARVKRWLAAPFAFASFPVTSLTILIYLGVFVSVLLTDELPNVPKNTRGLDIVRAYKELHEVSAKTLLLVEQSVRLFGQIMDWSCTVTGHQMTSILRARSSIFVY